MFVIYQLKAVNLLVNVPLQPWWSLVALCLEIRYSTFCPWLLRLYGLIDLERVYGIREKLVLLDRPIGGDQQQWRALQEVFNSCCYLNLRVDK